MNGDWLFYQRFVVFYQRSCGFISDSLCFISDFGWFISDSLCFISDLADLSAIRCALSAMHDASFSNTNGILLTSTFIIRIEAQS
ncbi:hypothetical protein [Lysinibacillus sp. RS5]|uniref:hypothetical protein n=1 Tax=unclassified Lysinibacillus TaxID=2636778 RepID=UPI0035BE9E44